MLEKYAYLSTDWLLFGKGTMYKDSRMQTLFENEKAAVNLFQIKSAEPNVIKTIDNIDNQVSNPAENTHNEVKETKGSISRIIWFYDNNSFEEYHPR